LASRRGASCSLRCWIKVLQFFFRWNMRTISSWHCPWVLTWMYEKKTLLTSHMNIIRVYLLLFLIAVQSLFWTYLNVTIVCKFINFHEGSFTLVYFCERKFILNEKKIFKWEKKLILREFLSHFQKYLSFFNQSQTSLKFSIFSEKLSLLHLFCAEINSLKG
jgi:hypothetical protein